MVPETPAAYCQKRAAGLFDAISWAAVYAWAAAERGDLAVEYGVRCSWLAICRSFPTVGLKNPGRVELGAAPPAVLAYQPSGPAGGMLLACQGRSGGLLASRDGFHGITSSARRMKSRCGARLAQALNH